MILEQHLDMGSTDLLALQTRILELEQALVEAADLIEQWTDDHVYDTGENPVPDDCPEYKYVATLRALAAHRQ